MSNSSDGAVKNYRKITAIKPGKPGKTMSSTPGNKKQVANLPVKNKKKSSGKNRVGL